MQHIDKRGPLKVQECEAAPPLFCIKYLRQAGQAFRVAVAVAEVNSKSTICSVGVVESAPLLLSLVPLFVSFLIEDLHIFLRTRRDMRTSSPSETKKKKKRKDFSKI